MKLRAVTILLFISMLAMGIFGFLGLGAAHSLHADGCQMPGMSLPHCLASGQAADMAMHHISIVKGALLAVFNIKNLILSLLISAVVFLTVIYSIRSNLFYGNIHFIRQKLKEAKGIIFISTRKFIYWLIILANRDPHTSFQGV